MSGQATTLAERIGTFVAGIDHRRVPDSTIATVKRVLLDTIGCALGALDAPPVRMLEQIVPDVGRDQRGATIFGSGRRSTAEGAAMVNGAQVRYLDFLDVYWSRDVNHPAENIPLAIACVEEIGGGGPALIEAILAGYETQIRLCDAFSFQDRGFHHVSAAGFVAPLVAGRAWGQSALQMAHGSVLAGSRHMTLGVISKGRLSMAKATGYPMNGSQGILSARLAGAGFTGPLRAYEWLFEKTRGPKENVDAMALDYDAWRIERISLKEFPVQYALQAPVAAGVRLHREMAGRHGAIRKIRVRVKEETLARAADPDKFRPENRETADHSLPCCVAMALCDGELTEAMFHRERYLDDDVLQLTGRMETVADATFEQCFPNGRPGAVEIEFDDGSTLEAVEAIPLGDRERPMTDAVVLEKFMSLARPVVGGEKAEAIASFIDDLPRQTTLQPLLQHCIAQH